MFSCSIFKSSAGRGISRLAAARSHPTTFPLRFRESRFDGFLDVGERLTLLTFNTGANRPLANNFVFHQIADEAPGSLWHVSCICPNDVQEKPSLKKANRTK
jgi:hypothetical protein